MPGKKDYVSVRDNDGKRVHVQKRLILSNIKELYQRYREQYLADKIGFSKFASLRPENCVLAGGSGTHTICVCALHQNIKLMVLGANLSSLTKDSTIPLQHYNDCLKSIICETPSFKCYFGKCNACPGTEKLSEILNEIFDQNEIDNITYKHWIANPHTNLETTIKSSTDFVDLFCNNLKVLLPHSYIAKEQASFMKSLKQSLKEDEFLVICDFAENYAFVVQNATAGFHWNNNQSTIFPVVIYFKVNNELTHESLVIISDCNKHDSVAVHVFCRITTNFVKSIFRRAAKIYYFSDGAPQQFENFKNFVNIYYHENDFEISAEWHFFATGKGPCDGIGGTIKRMAARASLQLPVDQQITTPFELYAWASKSSNISNITVYFSSLEDYTKAAEKLNDRYKNTKTISGTQKLHCIKPNKNGCITVKEYSNSEECRVCKLFKRLRK
ncbi:hypothetical protein ALC62_01467 [Cyphomyrmex costatus]|uniref:Uncharacterized protein n=1 Tax=Cyphomyrmex costatus TaxID=456900 RepID=A0A151IPK2_9HYME|nr:hypothetical protein ALC62_01467 [Cyphomyrmex costatus]